MIEDFDNFVEDIEENDEDFDFIDDDDDENNGGNDDGRVAPVLPNPRHENNQEEQLVWHKDDVSISDFMHFLLCSTNIYDYHYIKGYINHSKLVDFETNGPSALKDTRKPATKSMDFGSLVDCLLLQPDQLKSKFIVVDEEDMPVGMMKDIAEMRIDKHLARTFIDRYDLFDFCRKWDFYKSYTDKRLSALCEDNVEKVNNYIKNCSKIKITKDQLDKALVIVDKIKTSKVTGKLFNDPDIRIFTQVALFSNKLKTKVMFDILAVDEKNSKIYPIDLKTTSLNENDFLSAFYRFKYYRQAEMYMDNLIYHLSLCTDEKKYTVEPFRFLVVNSENPIPVFYEFPIVHNDEGRLVISKSGGSVEPYQAVMDKIKSQMYLNEFEYSCDIIEKTFTEFLPSINII